MTGRLPVRLLVVMALLISTSAAWAGGDAALVPSGDVPSGWQRDGGPKVYEGQGLYDLIDGGGEIFLELGFEACTLQRYARAECQMTAEIYRMADPAAALGIYLMNCGRERPSPLISARHTIGPTQLRLVRGRYYLVLTGSERGENLGDALVALAAAMTRGIPEAEAPAILSELPAEGLDPASVRVVRGPIGLQALVTLGEGDVLSLRPDATAVAGDYPGGRMVMVARYPSAARSTAALAYLKAHLDPLIAVRGPDETLLTLILPGNTRCAVTRNDAALRLEFSPGS